MANQKNNPINERVDRIFIKDIETTTEENRYSNNRWDLIIELAHPYYMILPIYEAQSIKVNTGNHILSYDAIYKSMMYYYPFLKYLGNELNNKTVMGMSTFGDSIAEALLYFMKNTNIKLNVIGYTLYTPTKGSDYPDIIDRNRKDILKLYSKYSPKLIIDDSKIINVRQYVSGLDVFIFPTYFDLSNCEFYDKILAYMNQTLQLLKLGGIFIHCLAYRSLNWNLVQTIICTLYPVFEYVEYYRNDIDITHFTIIYRGYKKKVQVEYQCDKPTYLVADINVIQQDIDRMNSIVSTNRTVSDIIKLLVYDNVNNISFLNKNIEACRYLGIQVKQSALDYSGDLEDAYLKYIKKPPKSVVKSIRGLKTSMKKGEKEEEKTFLDKYAVKLRVYKFFTDTRNIKKWTRISLTINMPLYIKKYVRETYNDDNVSRGFIKLYEICAIFQDLVATDCRSLHVCEAPGEFISATYHYTVAHNGSFRWNANSLNAKSQIAREKYGIVLGDQFGYIRNYPNNWLFGKDNTGDISIVENIEDIVEKAKKNLGFVNFFTSDCGLDVSQDYEEQERQMTKINLAQVVVCLRVLEKEGNAVFKMFLPLSLPSTLSVVFLLYSNFKKISIVKPIAGSPVSSEIYIVCEKFHGENVDYEYLAHNLKNFKDMFPLYTDYPLVFTEFIKKTVKKLVDKQIFMLKRIFYYYENDKVFREHMPLMEKYKKIVAEDWCKLVDFKEVKNKL